MDSGGERSDEGLAPVIPLFGGADPVGAPVVERHVDPLTLASRATSQGETPHRPAAFSEECWADDEATLEEPVANGPVPNTPDEPIDRDTLRENAATSLTRSLARRGLSVSEAKARLRSAGLTDEESAAVIAGFIDRGWLDDVVLAEQLVHAATSRKGMGTRAVRQLLVKRSVAREVIDEVIAELPDDDAERALAFARTKARSMRSLDRDTALRRLAGQLARRGYGGSAALDAARRALDESC